MKALSIMQPWASLIMEGHKRIESRGWTTEHRGAIAIHASANRSFKGVSTELWDYMNAIGFNADNLVYGAALGLVQIKTIVPADVVQDFTSIWREGIKWDNLNNEEIMGDYSPGRYGWLLANPTYFREPIPCKGQLRLWNYNNVIKNL